MMSLTIFYCAAITIFSAFDRATRDKQYCRICNVADTLAKDAFKHDSTTKSISFQPRTRVRGTMGVKNISDGISRVNDGISGVNDGISGVNDGISWVNDGISGIKRKD